MGGIGEDGRRQADPGVFGGPQVRDRMLLSNVIIECYY
jgi:hypothetical protein